MAEYLLMYWVMLLMGDKHRFICFGKAHSGPSGCCLARIKTIMLLFLIAIHALFLVTKSLEITYKIVHDSSVPDTVMKAVNASSVGQCSIKCTSDGNCGAANYDRTSGKCELLAEDQSDPSPLAKAGSEHLCCSCAGAVLGVEGDSCFKCHFTMH